MVTASVMVGRTDAGVIVWTPPPRMAKLIVSTPALPAAHSPAIPPEAVFVLAAVIASRRVHTPSLAAVSAALLTVIVLAPATRAVNTAAADTKRNDQNLG